MKAIEIRNNTVITIISGMRKSRCRYKLLYGREEIFSAIHITQDTNSFVILKRISVINGMLRSDRRAAERENPIKNGKIGAITKFIIEE